MAIALSCSGLVSAANILGWLATVFGIIALFSPFWYSSNPTFSIASRHVGLFFACSEITYQDCAVFWSDRMPAWQHSVLALWSIGCILMLVFTIANFSLCLEKYRKPKCGGIIFLGTLAAVASYFTAVVIYGVRANATSWFFVDKRNFEREDMFFFDWAFYLAIIATGIGLVAVGILATVIYYARKKLYRYN